MPKSSSGVNLDTYDLDQGHHEKEGAASPTTSLPDHADLKSTTVSV